MEYIAVDDEESALNDLEAALRIVQPDCELTRFTRPSKALEYAQTTRIDIAFLDVEMGSTNGLTIAKKLKDIQPSIHIIFVTGFEQYALGAIQLHATGYLLKPASADELRQELTFLYGEVQTKEKVRVQTFGGFDVFVNGEPLQFSRSKTKELFAILVDRRGSSITTAEACAILWEDIAIENGKKEYFRTFVKDMRKTLRDADVEDILIRTYNSLAIRTERLNCDSYRFLQGDAKAINFYRRDYMPAYSWAEFTLGEMESRFNK